MKIWRLAFAMLAAFALVAMEGQGQTAFDTGEGCLNVVDFTSGQGIGEYGDRCISANYMHERFINEQLCIGLGTGYSHHNEYKFSAIPFISAHTISFLTSVFRLLSISASEDSLCLTRRMLELTRNIPFPKIIRILAFIYHPALALKCILHQI